MILHIQGPSSTQPLNSYRAPHKSSEAIESHDPAHTGPLINQLCPSEAIESHDPAHTGPLINQLSPSEAIESHDPAHTGPS